MSSTDRLSVRANVDAVVIGSGHHGLVAAALLADAGWDVLVLEAQPEPGGAVRSAELTAGFTVDLFSAFYPMAVVSPPMRGLHLEDHGLSWTHAPTVVGHARSPVDDDAPFIDRDVTRTAADLERRYAGDGEAWLQVFSQWEQIKEALLESLFAPSRRSPGRCICCAGSAPQVCCASLISCCCRPRCWGRSSSVAMHHEHCCWATRCMLMCRSTHRVAA